MNLNILPLHLMKEDNNYKKLIISAADKYNKYSGMILPPQRSKEENFN